MLTEKIVFPAGREDSSQEPFLSRRIENAVLPRRERYLSDQVGNTFDALFPLFAFLCTLFFQQIKLVHVAEFVCELEHFSIQGISGIEIETARFKGINKTQLRIVVDQAVVNTLNIMLNRIIERSDYHAFIGKALLGIIPVEPPEDSSHI